MNDLKTSSAGRVVSVSAPPLLSVEGLHISIKSRDGAKDLRVVNGVTFQLERGQTLAIIGESGCGKSTTALAIMRLLPRTARTAGHVLFAGENVMEMSEDALRRLRGRRISMIMQDPMVALDPLFTVGTQLGESLKLHLGLKGAALYARKVELLKAVGIPSPEVRLKQYPHQMSGGMLQRIVGAIAISCNPQLLIADEPTTSLDPTAQAQFLDLLIRLRDEQDLGLIVVTHDFGVTARLADHVLVMYAGVVAEYGRVRDIFNDARHPYTRALLGSMPHDHEGEKRAERRLRTIDGQPPDLAQLPPACPFAPRCPKVMDRCTREMPPPFLVGGVHEARCWLADEAA